MRGPAGYAPVGNAPPPTKPLNQGECTLTGSKLAICWNPVGGLPTVETFANAYTDARQMNGTSNRYSPLVATRI